MSMKVVRRRQVRAFTQAVDIEIHLALSTHHTDTVLYGILSECHP